MRRANIIEAMHQASTHKRHSIFYDYKVYPYAKPAELEGKKIQHTVAVVGAGPVGLATTLDLARQGIKCVLLSADQQVSEGSRALVYTRRSMEILQQMGVADKITATGLPWRFGNSIFRGQVVYRLDVPHDADDRFWPLINLQQQYLEQYLLEQVQQHPLIALRMGHKLLNVQASANGVVAAFDTPDGEYALNADWLVACDGARSLVRQSLGLRLEGTSYEGQFVIADIRADLGLPTERLAFFDPAWNPGNTMLMHKEPHGLWRVDFQLPKGESPQEALQMESLTARINAQLELIGKGGTPWEMDWCSVYSARTLTLPSYVHERVVFVGDSAHLLPIFGVRGANTGFQDGHNMAWKLALTIKGMAGQKLLQSYSDERVSAAREIIDEASKSVRFMTPPTAGFRLMRDAVLSLSLTQAYVRPLMNWRTSRPHEYTHSGLNAVGDDNHLFSGGFANGAPLRNIKLADNSYLMDHLGASFYLFVFHPKDEVAADLLQAVGEIKQCGVPIQMVQIRASGKAVDSGSGVDLVFDDTNHHIRARFGIQHGEGAYLIRPDHHVCGRWLHMVDLQLKLAMSKALGHTNAQEL